MKWIGKNIFFLLLFIGIACFRCKRFEDSKVSLNQANFYDPYNFDIWGYIVLFKLLKA